MIEMNFSKRLVGMDGDFKLSIKLNIAEGEFITLFGQSGVGKTTILRILAGLTKPESGFIKVDGKVWFDSSNKINLSPQNRNIGFVFQDYALFPNMTVRKNLNFALSNRTSQSKKMIDELLNIMGLYELQNRKPETLSGGQKQRVALARALVRKPKILLLDEPLSALDIGMRVKLQDEILSIHKRFGITTLIVSHDLSEVFKLSNQVFVIENGQIIKSGHPLEIFTENRISGKFKLFGEVLDIQKNDVVYVVSVLCGNNILEIIAMEEEIKDYHVGTKVIVFTKSLKPMIVKMDHFENI